MPLAPFESPTFLFSLDSDTPSAFTWDAPHPFTSSPRGLSPTRPPSRPESPLIKHRRSRDSLLPSHSQRLGLALNLEPADKERPQSASGALPSPSFGGLQASAGGDSAVASAGNSRPRSAYEQDTGSGRTQYERKISTTSLRTDYSSLALSPAASVESLRHSARLALGKALVEQGSRDRLRGVEARLSQNLAEGGMRASPSLSTLRYGHSPRPDGQAVGRAAEAGPGSQFGTAGLSPLLSGAGGPSPAPTWQSTLSQLDSIVTNSPVPPSTALTSPNPFLPFFIRSPSLIALARISPSPSLPSLSTHAGPDPANPTAASTARARKPRPKTLDFRRASLFAPRSLSHAHLGAGADLASALAALAESESAAEGGAETGTPAGSATGAGSTAREGGSRGNGQGQGRERVRAAVAPLTSFWVAARDATSRRRPLGFLKRGERQLAGITEDASPAKVATAHSRPTLSPVAAPTATLPADSDAQLRAACAAVAGSLTLVVRSDIGPEARAAKIAKWLGGVQAAGEPCATDPDWEAGDGDYSLVESRVSFEESL